MESILDEAEKKPKGAAEKPLPIKKPSDLQRLKLQKLMKNIDKPIIIPERPKEKNITNAPEFVRNVMGSSAGAGSGEFHVYRHLRRKEYARQKFIQIKSEKEKLDEAYRQKLEDNAKLAEERTAKKRAKRLKKKEKMKNRKKNKTGNDSQKTEEIESSESRSEDSEKEDEKGDKDVSAQERENADKNDDNNSNKPENKN